MTSANEQRAIDAFRSFHLAAAAYPERYRATLDELVAYLRALDPTFLDRFGKALGYATAPGVGSPLSAADVDALMSRIARDARGALPATPSDLVSFFDAISRAYDPSKVSRWLDVGAAAVPGIVDDVTTAATLGVSALALYGLVAVVVFALAQGRGKS